jgi:hypothetical protein
MRTGPVSVARMGGGMRYRAAGVVWAVLAAGCHTPGPVPVRPEVLTVPVELPAVEPVPLHVEPRHVPKPDPRVPTGPAPEGTTFRGLTEPACQALAARAAGAANLLDDENRLPGTRDGCETPATRTRRLVRHFTALELRNQAAGAALERFFQLADAEARSALLRDSLPVLDGQRALAEMAKAAGLRYPLDAADLSRQRSQVLSQLAQADAGVALLNLDLRRRLGLTDAAGERLWPAADFGIDPHPVDADTAVGIALAERPELRAWRALHDGLTPDTLEAVRDQLRGVSPLLGAAVIGEMPCGARLLLVLGKCLGRKPPPDPAALAELEVRRKQLADLIADRERAVADETRAAAIGMNAQLKQVALARERVDGWKAKWDDAAKQREAKIPGAELAEAQARLEWLRARAEVVAEVMGWHQARVRLKAAQGRLAGEPAAPGPDHMSLPPPAIPAPVVPWVVPTPSTGGRGVPGRSASGG